MRGRAMQVLVGVLLALATVLLAARFDAFAGSPPTDLGLREGRLKPPSSTPNSVSSQADLWPDHPQRTYARIAPLPQLGDGVTTMARLMAVVEGMAGAKIVERRPDYLYVQFTTRLMRYVDDAEFWFDPVAGVVHVRSASRLGRSDLGVNRSRIESIRAQLTAG